MAVSYADKKNRLHRFSKWGQEGRFDFSQVSNKKGDIYVFTVISCLFHDHQRVKYPRPADFPVFCIFQSLDWEPLSTLPQANLSPSRCQSLGGSGTAEPALVSWDCSQATQKRTSQVTSYTATFLLTLLLPPKRHINQNVPVKHIWGQAGRGKGQEELPHQGAGIRVSRKAAQDGWGRAWNTNAAQGQHAGRGTARSSRAEQGKNKSPKQLQLPLHQRQVWPRSSSNILSFLSHAEHLVCYFQLKISELYLLCQGHFLSDAFLHGTLSWFREKLGLFWGFGSVTNPPDRGTHVMPFPSLLSSAQASVSTSLWIIWKWHMEEVRF